LAKVEEPPTNKEGSVIEITNIWMPESDGFAFQPSIERRYALNVCAPWKSRLVVVTNIGWRLMTRKKNRH
jgi:hypothetical protein